MQCGRCAAENLPGNRFCEACGQSLEPVCPACGARFRAGARFCGQCGAPVASPAIVAPRMPGADAGERKHVTILFADIRGSTELIRALDPEQAIEQLDPALEAMKQAVRRYGGTVNRVQGDGIMAMFGAPIAQEDHAANACLAARAMIAAVQALGAAAPQIRIGMHSGTVVVRPTGNDPSDWDAVGIAAHLANRMEQLARAGTACISAETARLAFGFIDAAPLGPVEVRGMAAPVEAFELLSAVERPSWEVRASAHPLTRFVGRGAELSLLMDALRRAGLGRGQAVTIRADAGMGKSRLAQEFLREVPSGWAVLRVAALPHDRGSPYRLAGDLLRAWLGLEPATEPAVVERRLVQALALGDARLTGEAAALRALLDLPTDAAWEQAPAAQRRARTLAALRLALLAEARTRPVVILVEDLHWIDAGSDEALAGIVAACAAARLLLVATTRPEHAAPWTSHGWSSEIRLPPLDADSAEVVLHELLGAAPELAALRRHIIAQTEGTPFFIEEIARSLRETGVVVEERARPRLTRRLAEIDIPASVQGVLAARIDRLPPARRTLLHVAAVIGKDVPFALLHAVAGLAEEALLAELAELRAGEFLYEIDLPTGTEYTFKHALTHAVAYESMLRRHRRELHARVLAALERGGEGGAAAPEHLAHHAMRGEVWERAALHAHEAGKRANARSAWREAIAFFEMALEALRHLPDAAEHRRQGVAVRLRLRVPLGPLGEYKRSAAYLEEARALAAGLGDERRIASIDMNVCLMLTNLGRLDEAVAAGRRSLTLARGLEDAAGSLSASYALGQAHWFRGDLAEAEAVLSAELPSLRGEMRLRDAGTTGTASVLTLVCLSKTLALTGRIGESLALAAEARGIAEETRRPYDRSYAHLAEGYARLLGGDAAAALGPLEQALCQARAAEIALLVPSIARYLGRAYAAAGRHDAAEALLDEALALTTTQGLVGLTAWCKLALGETRLARGAEAAAVLAEALALAERHGYRPAAAQAHRLLGRVHGAARREHDAQAALDRAIALADSLGMHPEAAAARRDAASFVQRSGQARATAGA